MTRVLHITDCYLPRLGGIEVHVNDLAIHPRGVGTEARVATITASDPGHRDPEWVHRLGRRPGRPASDPGRSLVAADGDLRELLSRWRPDVVHVHVSIFSPFATLAAWRATSGGLATLITVHSMWTRLGPLPGAAQAMLRLRDWPVLWTAVSDAAARPLRDMLGHETPVAVLPNAIDPHVWQPVRPAGDADADDEGVTLISVMRLTRTKRAMPLLRTLREVRRAVPEQTPFRAIVIGDGPQRQAVARFVRRNQMESWVQLPGRQDRREVRRVLSRADCFVAPAERESFGIAALEARALGLPVVASTHSGVGEFIRHGQEGLLVRDDHAMVAAISRMITDSALRESIREHNRRVPVEHDWVAALSRTRTLYGAATSIAAAARLDGAVTGAAA